jgi:RNA recognition motif-containing protein
MNIYIGNIVYTMDNDGLKDLFSQYGEVKSAKVIMDRETNRSKGFGFVEMVSDEAGKSAIEDLDGKEVSGRKVKVNEARPKAPRY